MKNNLPQAKIGENLASLYLQKKGYQIIQRNFHSRFGEIDIIALNKNNLVFIEVKSRWSEEYGFPQEAVTKKKIQNITKTGEYFKICYPKTPDNLRIDVIAINFSDENNYKIEHLVNVTG